MHLTTINQDEWVK